MVLVADNNNMKKFTGIIAALALLGGAPTAANHIIGEANGSKISTLSAQCSEGVRSVNYSYSDGRPVSVTCKNDSGL